MVGNSPIVEKRREEENKKYALSRLLWTQSPFVFFSSFSSSTFSVHKIFSQQNDIEREREIDFLLLSLSLYFSQLSCSSSLFYFMTCRLSLLLSFLLFYQQMQVLFCLISSQSPLYLDHVMYILLLMIYLLFHFNCHLNVTKDKTTTVVCKYAIQWFISSTDKHGSEIRRARTKPLAMYASAEFFVLLLLSLP